jgi:hypothetical protein
MHRTKLNALGLVIVTSLVACGQSAAKHSSPAAMVGTRTVVAPSPSPSPTPDYGAVPVSAPGPLPGQNLPISGPLPYPLLIQIENTDPARPQAGLQAASVIFESISEGGITRFSALYHRVPGVVGPVRSARFVSVYLYHHFGALLMASGGSSWTYQRIFADPGLPALINDFDGGRHFFRWNGRLAPHNLYTSQGQMLNAAGAHARAAQPGDFPRSPVWAYPEPAPSVAVPDLRSQFNYADGTYGVITDGQVQADVVFGQVRVQTVAVLHVRQWITAMQEDVTGGHARDFDLASGGLAEIYSRGTVVRGHWDSPTPDVAIRLLGPDGLPITIPPGLTWVALAG